MYTMLCFGTPEIGIAMDTCGEEVIQNTEPSPEDTKSDLIFKWSFRVSISLLKWGWRKAN